MSICHAGWMSAYLCLAGSVTLCAAQEWTEQAILEEFLNQSPVARQVKARTDAVRAEAQGRTLYANPQVNFSHESAGLNQFFEAQQTVPLSGRRRFLQEAGTAAVEVSESEGAAQMWNLRTDVRRAFYRLVAAQEFESTLSGGTADLDEAIRILLAREAAGEGSTYDRLRAQRERLDLASQLASARATVAQARGGLSVYLPPQTAVTQVRGTLAVSAMVPSTGELAERALASRAEYRAEQQQAVRYQAEQKAADRLRRPEPTVAAGLKRAALPELAGSALRDYTAYGPVVTVTVPIPLFNKGRTEAARFRAEQEQAAARRETLERRIRAEAAGARETLLLRQAALETYRTEAAQTSSELIRIARTSYQEGEAGILELLDSFRIGLQARTRLIELQAAVKEAALELDRAVGMEVTQ
jgi:cobalt-zinc-cadmium efflux system outer membrane protein